MNSRFALGVPALLAAMLALAGCGGKGDRTEGGSESDLASPCAIEFGFDRSATEQQIEDFRRRVDALPHVTRIEFVSREEFIENFTAQLRQAGYSGDEFEYMHARAVKYAGVTLVATPDKSGDVSAIIQALGLIPAVVTSVWDRDSCRNTE